MSEEKVHFACSARVKHSSLCRFYVSAKNQTYSPGATWAVREL